MFTRQEGFEAEKIVVLHPFQLNEMTALPQVRDIYITDIGYYTRATGHHRERTQGCDAFILIYCVGGQGWIRFGERDPFLIREQMLTIIPADTAHAYGADDRDPWSIYWFHFKGEQASGLAESIGLEEDPLQLSLSDAGKLLELFHQCYDLLLDKAYSPAHLLHVSHTVRYLLSFLGLIPKRGQAERSEAYIEQAILYMQEKLESDLALEELADHTRISRQHLNHLFKQATGFAPIDYYLRMKMQRACQLLDLTGGSVKEIALSIGISDPYYFSRLFKKLIGISPSEYRSRLKG